MFKECLSWDAITGNEEMGKACLLGEASTSLDTELGGEESPGPIENFTYSTCCHLEFITLLDIRRMFLCYA